MAGRLLSPLLLTALFLLLRVARRATGRQLAVAACLVAIIGLATPHSPPLTGADYGQHREDIKDSHDVADERGFYYSNTSLLGASHRAQVNDHPWGINGRRALRAGDSPVAKRTIGFFGYYAGPRIHIVDRFGLADPLLARLAPTTTDAWRAGHLERDLPAGYLAAVVTSPARIDHPELAQYYEKLVLITRGDLGDPARWRAILELNLGKYDHYLATYAGNQ